MAQTPSVFTRPEMTQMSGQTICLIQPDEILRVRTPAYSKSNADVSFLVRQPSASAMLVNRPELQLELQFTLDSNITVKDAFVPGSANAGANGAYTRLAPDSECDYVRWPQMFPLQQKCIRNAVISINGASSTYRLNEFGVEYGLLHGSREFFEKETGTGINDYTIQFGGQDPGKRDKQKTVVENRTQAMQRQKFINAMLEDKKGASGQYENDDMTKTAVISFREPLYCGPFGAFQNMDSFPHWSAEGSKTPAILHAHTMQLQFALEENWWRSLYLGSYMHSPAGHVMGKVVGVEIKAAHLYTKWLLPPPRVLAASLSQQVSYASYDTLRFLLDAQDNPDVIKHDGTNLQFRLNHVSFPYMPSLFVFSICPHYAHALRSIGKRAMDSSALEACKDDKRLTISHMDLTINTSTNAVAYDGSNKVITKRLNARELYRMTLENCHSINSFAHSFEDWYYSCCIVALSPSQLSGVINSPNIRGTVTISGTVFGRNMSGHPVNIGTSNLTYDDGNNMAQFPSDEPVPRYRCFITGMYCNKSLVLDAKSGLINETTFSSAFGQSLRMGGAAT